MEASPPPTTFRPNSFQIDQARGLDDWRMIRKLCCLTGASGDPIDEAHWGFFSDFWIGPYERLAPHWTYVIRAQDENEAPQIVGYLTGCPNTASFERKRGLANRLPLFLEVVLGRHRGNPDARRFLQRALRLEPSPERSFPPEVRERITSEYPAHLHMNLDARFRKHGLGRRLIERYFEDLKTAGTPGIHLFCGAKPVEFYARVGLEELGRIEFWPGISVHALGKKL